MRKFFLAALTLAGAAQAQASNPIGYPADFASIFNLEFGFWNQHEKPLPIAPIPDPSYDPDDPWPPNCIVCGQNAFLQDEAVLLGAEAGTPVLFGVGDLPLMPSQIANYQFRATQGPLIQVPWFGYPVAIPVRNPAVMANGGAVLDDNDLCGIFSGRLTDWGMTSAGRAGQAASGPITVVYRQDATGGAEILTAHFAKVCTPNNSNFGFPLMPTPVLWGALPNGVPGNFVAANSAAQAQSLLLQLPSAIGFLPPGYTAIAPQARETSPLFVAAVVNSKGIAVLPDTPDTMAALAAPSSNATNPVPPTGAAAADPTRWIPADPTPRKGYPLVGYETAVFSTCYAASPGAEIPAPNASDSQLIELLLYRLGLTTPTVVSYLGQEGIVESPAKWTKAVNATFLTAGSLNLSIQNAAVCTGLQGR